jgi:hypothetical protein
MSGPSVVGRLLEEAERILAEHGIAVAEVKRTESPLRSPAGPLRVVRERRTPEGVQLLVAAMVPLPEPEVRDR